MHLLPETKKGFQSLEILSNYLIVNGAEERTSKLNKIIELHTLGVTKTELQQWGSFVRRGLVPQNDFPCPWVD